MLPGCYIVGTFGLVVAFVGKEHNKEQKENNMHLQVSEQVHTLSGQRPAATAACKLLTVFTYQSLSNHRPANLVMGCN